jgi:hypothetical protein
MTRQSGLGLLEILLALALIAAGLLAVAGAYHAGVSGVEQATDRGDVPHGAATRTSQGEGVREHYAVEKGSGDRADHVTRSRSRLTDHKPPSS